MKLDRPTLRLLAALFLGLRPPIVAAGEAPPAAPSAIATSRAGSVFLADLVRPGVFRRDSEGRGEWIVTGSPRHRAPFHAVTALAAGNDGTLFLADRSVGEVYRAEPGHFPVGLSGGAFEVPSGLALSADGGLIVCDLRLSTLFRVPQSGGPVTVLARVQAPRGVALGEDGEIVVLSMGPDQLVRVSPEGVVVPIVKGKPFRFPLALARDGKHGRWLVSDGDAHAVWEVPDKGGPRPWVQGAPLVRPEGLALDLSGALLVADPRAGKVFRVTGPDSIQTWHPAP